MLEISLPKKLDGDGGQEQAEDARHEADRHRAEDALDAMAADEREKHEPHDGDQDAESEAFDAHDAFLLGIVCKCSVQHWKDISQYCPHLSMKIIRQYDALDHDTGLGS